MHHARDNIYTNLHAMESYKSGEVVEHECLFVKESHTCRETIASLDVGYYTVNIPENAMHVHKFGIDA